MIRPIHITLNAAHPELPLIEASTYVGSPSTAFVRGVPAAIGNWKITAVRVIFHYPDESVVAAACVNSATGVWVGTIAPTSTSGRVANGYQILADGTDENGDAVTGYVLGMGDLAVYTRDMTIDAGETFWYFHYFDTAPTTPKKSDVAHVDGVLKFYNGTAWESFAAGITLDDAVTRTSANGVKSSGIWAAIWGALAALPSGFTSLYDWVVAQLAGKASTADATLTERGFSEWSFSDGNDYEVKVFFEEEPDPETPWKVGVAGAYGNAVYASEEEANYALDHTLTSISFSFGEDSITATRTALPGYQLGSQSSKPIASEQEAADLRTAVAGKLASSDVIDPANATASGKAADALATKTALGGKQASITASGILKGNGQGGVSAATAGTDYQAPLGFTPENAANKVTSLSSGSTDTQYPSAKCVYDALQGVDVKPTRIYNESGTDALDDKGQLFKSDIPSQSSFTSTKDGVTTNWLPYRFQTEGSEIFHNHAIYSFGGFNNFIAYDPTDGVLGYVYAWNGYYEWDVAVPKGLDPRQVGVVLFSGTIRGQFGANDFRDVTFNARIPSIQTTPYAHLALESLPDRTWAAGAWAVGDLVKYDGKAYRCKSATTSSDTTAPSSDTTHWDEIPVLAQKADTADLRYSFNTATVASGTTPTVTNVLDRAINAATLGSTVTAATITLPAAVGGRSRDFFLDLTIEATDAPTLTFVDPATGTTANVAFGADALADIDTGDNLVLWTELPNNRWLVSVKHEEAA